MITVEINVNGRVIARAVVANPACDQQITNYSVRAETLAPPSAKRRPSARSFLVTEHDRRASPWALAAKVAGEVLDLERRGS